MALFSTLNADALMAAAKKEILPALAPLGEDVVKSAEPLIDDAIARASASFEATAASAEQTGLDWAATHKLVMTPKDGRIEFTLEPKT